MNAERLEKVKKVVSSLADDSVASLAKQALFDMMKASKAGALNSSRFLVNLSDEMQQGFSHLANALIRSVIDHDSSNAAAYKGWIAEELQRRAAQVEEIVRKNGRPEKWNDNVGEKIITELRGKLQKICDRTITEFDLVAVTSPLDELDSALAKIDSHLVDVRKGAWSAVDSDQPDAVRQAAHSGRELVTQLLHVIAADTEVKAQQWFVPDKESKTGITRRMRLKLAIQKRQSGSSESDLEIVEAAAELLEALHRKLSAIAHFRGAADSRFVAAYLGNLDLTLRLILL